MKKHITILIIALILLPMLYQTVLGQTGPAGPPPSTPGVPIDGGIGLLLAGLGSYAYKKFGVSKKNT